MCKIARHHLTGGTIHGTPGPPHAPSLLYPFRFRDPVSGRRVRARYVAERAEHPKDLPTHVAAYWNFIEAMGGDRAALKAFAEGSYPPLSVVDVQSIKHPILVISGDRVLGRGPRLASALANAQYLEVAGADHFALSADTTVQDAVVTHRAGGKP